MQSDYLDVPAGKIAAVVTHLQMMAHPSPRQVPDVSAQLVRHNAPDLDWYRDLFKRVGEDWLWFSRRGMSDAELAAVIHDNDVQVYSVQVDGRDEGMLELDFREAGECELGYFGLTTSMLGTGAGRWLMDHAIRLAWAQPITRMHVHTCTLDSPAALAFYIRSGFTPYRRQVEIADDPRVVGVMPATAAPQEPII